MTPDPSATAISPQPSASPAPGAVCRVAIAGFGTVGAAVAKLLLEREADGVRLTHIFNRSVERKKVDWVPRAVRWTDRFDDLLAPDVDVLVEVAGGVEPAGDWIRRAMHAGKSVVTANKQLLAQHGAELIDLARRRGVALRFEASVAGGIPVIRAVQEGLAADRLFRVAGILNGTCNYILSRMESGGLPFADALGEAQQKGFAEADPAADIDGLDASAKLVILTAIGLRRWIRPEDVPCRSIAPLDGVDFTYARRLDCTIRQISFAEVVDAGRTVAWVGPALVHRDSALARVEGSQNLVTVRGVHGGETAFSGLGAGGFPTAVAVLSDVLSIARGDRRSPAGTSSERTSPGVVHTDSVTPWYVRCTVTDRPGIIAALAGTLSACGINIDAVLQEPGHPKARLPFVLTLEPCAASAVARAVGEIAALSFNVAPPLALPVI